MSKPDFLKKTTEADIRGQYPKHLEIGYIVSLAFLIVIFYAMPKLGEGMEITKLPDITVVVEDIPQTKEHIIPPPPSPPSMPKASDDEDFPKDVAIDDAIFEPDYEFILPESLPEEIDKGEYEFTAISKKPKLIKQTLPKYPEIARTINLEGTVVCEIVVGEDGRVIRATVFKSIPMLDEAALSAVKSWIFTPGEQRDRKVKVRMRVPVQFKLKN